MERTSVIGSGHNGVAFGHYGLAFGNGTNRGNGFLGNNGYAVGRDDYASVL